MPLAGFHCIAEKIQDSLSLVDEYRLIESTCFFNFRVGNKFSYLGHPAIGKNKFKSAVSLGLFSKVSVHFFLPGSSITSFLSQITVSFSKLFNKIAFKSFLVYFRIVKSIFGLYIFWWIKYCLFISNIYTHW